MTEVKHLTDLEHQALRALVAEYGPEYIIEVVQDIGFDLAVDEYDAAIARGDI